MTSSEMRSNPLFMRNEFEGDGRWGIPLIRKQPLIKGEIKMIAASNTKPHDSEDNLCCGVYFTVDDYRFTSIYNNPGKSFQKYSQYAFLLAPDFSTYSDMKPWRQLESVAHSRWCGAWWQRRGKVVYPMMSWSTPESYSFCFDGVEKNAVVAVGMNGCKKNNRLNFMRGYNAMLERLEPEAVICVGKPFPEMQGNLIVVEHHESRRRAN